MESTDDVAGLWMFLSSVVGTGGEVPIVGPSAVGSTQRFYRVVPQE